ncbi:hypothetical protein GBA52_024062 [Prunus armeniaca]|nr:hypothetical protein GBA52_024062 [Prunus armeniaca]
MSCCGGAEEENFGPPANQYNAAPPRGGSTYGAGGNDRGEPRSSNTVKSGAPQKALPIEIPAMSLDELNRLTGNFGQKALIGEGSYGRVFYAKLSNGKNAAIKKLDTSQEPDSDFSAQLSTVSRLKHEHFVELMGYCLDANNRILIYEFAAMGSLHDILHGILSYIFGFCVCLYICLFADFNLTNQSSDTAARLHSTRVLGTFGYHAPELSQLLLVLLFQASNINTQKPLQATPRLSEDKVKQCIDPKLNNDFQQKAIAKLAAVAALCVQYEADFRPNMTIVVKALQPLLNSKPAGPDSNA